MFWVSSDMCLVSRFFKHHLCHDCAILKEAGWLESAGLTHPAPARLQCVSPESYTVANPLSLKESK